MKTLIAGILFAISLFSATPDCQVMYHFTNRSGDIGQYGQQLVQITNNGNDVSPSFNNTIMQCSSWSVSYNSEGLSALSLQFEDAPNSYSSGNTAGTFVAFAGTSVIGTNPMSTTTSNNYQGTGYYPWMRVNLVSKTGTGSIDIVMQGWKSPSYIGLNRLQTATITLATAQITGLFATPILFIPSPGGGNSIHILSCTYNAVFNTTAFAAGGAIGPFYGPVSFTMSTGLHAAATLLTSFSANQVLTTYNTGNGAQGTTQVANQPIYIGNLTQAFTGGGTSSLFIQCYYFTQGSLV